MKQSEANCYHSGTFLHPAKWSNDFSIKRCLSYQSLIFSEFPAYFLLRYTILRYCLELFLQQKKSLDHKCHNCIHHYLPRAHDPHKSFTRQLHHHCYYASPGCDFFHYLEIELIYDIWYGWITLLCFKTFNVKKPFSYLILLILIIAWVSLNAVH